MKRAAAIVALFVAVILFGKAISMYREDGPNPPSDIAQGLPDSNISAAPDEGMHKADPRGIEEHLYEIGGGIFLVAGSALFARRKESPQKPRQT